jgi:DNA-binding response OmpR family regulator
MENKIILLVEDNANDEALTLRALKRGNIGNEVDVVRDGAEAVEYLLGAGEEVNRQNRDLPHLVLLDLKLPKLDGLEVLRRIRGAEHTKALPVVIFTSSKEERDIVEGYRLGANSYIRKPIDFTEFAETVRQLGLYWLILNEPIPSSGHP